MKRRRFPFLSSLDLNFRTSDLEAYPERIGAFEDGKMMTEERGNNPGKVRQIRFVCVVFNDF